MRHKLLKFSAVILFVIGLTDIQAQMDYVFTDSRDGNVYETVKIGNQVWMAENLRYILKVSDPIHTSSVDPYCYIYGYNKHEYKININDDIETINTYGVLYNWPAVMGGPQYGGYAQWIDSGDKKYSASSEANPSGVRGVCPEGWHIPSDAEWTELTDYLGGPQAGGKLKEAGLSHWGIPNFGATNKTGFTALPGGYAYQSIITKYYLARDTYSGKFRQETGQVPVGSYSDMGEMGYWWSATEVFGSLSKSDKAYARGLSTRESSRSSLSSGMYRDIAGKELGYSCRCVKD